MFTVTTVSGFEMILADAGRDSEGNQLWRQVHVGTTPPQRTGEPCLCGKCIVPIVNLT